MTVLSITPPGFATLAAMLMPVTAFGSEEYWKLPSRTSVFSSKAGSAEPRISPLAQRAIESSPPAVRFLNSRV